MGRRKQAGVRQEKALDRQEYRNDWKRTGIAGGGMETRCGFGKERFIETKTKKVKCFLKELLI
jgi:hypothetical protein